MGDAQSLRHAAGVLNILAGAAGALAADRLAVVVELERDADHVIALTLQEGRDHGGVDPPDMATTTLVSAGRPGK